MNSRLQILHLNHGLLAIREVLQRSHIAILGVESFKVILRGLGRHAVHQQEGGGGHQGALVLVVCGALQPPVAVDGQAREVGGRHILDLRLRGVLHPDHAPAEWDRVQEIHGVHGLQSLVHLDQGCLAPRDDLHLHDVAVHPKQGGQGLGRDVGVVHVGRHQHPRGPGLVPLRAPRLRHGRHVQPSPGSGAGHPGGPQGRGQHPGHGAPPRLRCDRRTHHRRRHL
mmetsp:Transcript_22043/g.31990  ORF Transcript_22043/g.31990 Transcript_22043/m.31990 type:complete len:225 (+) Transcript_22043:153-827(+)